ENPHRCENSCKIITRKDYPHSHHMYGARLSELGLYESAVESYKKALALDTERPQTLDLLSRAYIELESITDAKKTIKAIRQSWPYYPGLSELDGLIEIKERWYNRVNNDVDFAAEDRPKATAENMIIR
ncbi:MAG: hypothetical protein GY855_04400, partial [candidate division Zixibacteria bacterium]|nr:hypothetical protein [candidate division Zixibacteria bacterium]